MFLISRWRSGEERESLRGRRGVDDDDEEVGDADEGTVHDVFKFGGHGRVSNARASIDCVSWYRFLRLVQRTYAETLKRFEASVAAFLAASSIEELMFPFENSNSHFRMCWVFPSGAAHFQVPEE